MAYSPDDKRALYQRVVDDLRDQIRNGAIPLDARVPSANELADKYGIAPMTAQRALRELQNEGLIFAIQGKGSFVRPDAAERLRGKATTDNSDGAEAEVGVNPQLASYLLARDTLAEKTIELFTTRDKTRQAEIRAELTILSAILDSQRADLQDKHAHYKADLTRAAGQTDDPERRAGGADKHSPAEAKPAKRAPRKPIPKP